MDVTGGENVRTLAPFCPLSATAARQVSVSRRAATGVHLSLSETDLNLRSQLSVKGQLLNEFRRLETSLVGYLAKDECNAHLSNKTHGLFYVI